MLRWGRLFIACIVAAACGGETATAPSTPAHSATDGRSAFTRSCAPCHASGDGFDLAYFGFPDSVVVRRALKHVDRATADQIVTYLHSLGVTPVATQTPLFQPGAGRVDGSDESFWKAAIGGASIDAATPSALLSVDPRRLSAPIRTPVWSSETDDTDWMPNNPLPQELLSANGNELRSALAAYYAGPSMDAMLNVVASFQRAIGQSDMCTGEIAFHKRPVDCFEARRWLSSFAAVHLLRNHVDTPPISVLDLWWDTGEAAVSMYFRKFPQQTGDSPSMVNGWLYLAYSYAPYRFPDDGGYLEQFLQQDLAYPLMATFTALRRMVDPRPSRDPALLPAHQFTDALNASTRAPTAMKADVLQWAYDYLGTFLDAQPPMTAAARDAARSATTNAFTYMTNAFGYAKYTESATKLDKLRASRDRLIDRLSP